MGVHVDFEGKELKLGDEIIFNPSANSSLVRGTVIGFTPKMTKCLRKGTEPTRSYTYHGKTHIVHNGSNRTAWDIYKL